MLEDARATPFQLEPSERHIQPARLSASQPRLQLLSFSLITKTRRVELSAPTGELRSRPRRGLPPVEEASTETMTEDPVQLESALPALEARRSSRGSRTAPGPKSALRGDGSHPPSVTGASGKEVEIDLELPSM